MKPPAKKSIPTPPPTASLHITLPRRLLLDVDALADANNLTRGAVIAIALTRIVKTGV